MLIAPVFCQAFFFLPDLQKQCNFIFIRRSNR
nr:MAG TPA: hypothetical protein [Caudoviricetes sp.]